MHCVVGALFGFYEHFIDINLHRFIYQGLEYPGHHPLISYPCIFQAKRHYVVVVQPVGCDEDCFLLVRLEYGGIRRMSPETTECHTRLLYPQSDLSVVRGSCPWDMIR